MRVIRAYLSTAVLTGFLAIAMAGCGDDQPAMSPGAGDSDLATVTLDLGLAPTDAKCAVITVTPAMGTPVVQSITLVPQQPTVFTMSGLPVGTVTFTQQVFTIACSAVTATTPATWITDPVTVSLAAGQPVDLQFSLRRVDAGGVVTIHDDFPANPNQTTIVNVGVTSLFIATGPDALLWFSTNGSDQSVHRISPSGVAQSSITIATDASPDDLTPGPDGNMWVAARSGISGDRIARVTPGGTVTQFFTGNSEPEIQRIAAGPDGNLWFTNTSLSQVGRMTTGGSVTFFPTLTANARPTGITAGPDGNVWFTEQIGRIARITPTGGITEFTTPTASAGIDCITTGPDGNIWYVSRTRAGRVTPTGAITEFTVPASSYEGITAGPDGNVWFVAQGPTQIRRITPAGVVSSFETGSPGFNFFSIATGPDANLWVTDVGAANLVKFKP